MIRLPGTSLVDAFRRDRWLAVAFAVLSISALVPLFCTPLIPSPDLPGNVGSSALLWHTALRHGIAPDYYRVLWQPFPYWFGYLFLGGSTLLLGPFAAAKLLVGLLVLALPLGVMRLCLALGRDPRLALWAFLLSWEHNLHAGWHSYVLGMAVALVLIAKTLEMRDDRAAIRVIPWSLGLVLTHALPLGFAGLAIVAAMALQPAIRSLRRVAIAFGPTALVVVPWLAVRIAAHEPARGALTVEYPEIAHKVRSLFSYSLDDVPGRFGGATSALAFTLLLLVPLVLARWPEPEGPDEQRWAAFATPLVALLLYVALPMTIYGPVDHWYTYPRFASYFLAGWLLVPRPDLAGRRGLVLVPGLVLAVACHLATALRFHDFGQRAAPFLEIYAAVPPNTRLLPLEYIREDPAARAESFAHVHSYLTGGKILYDPHLYDNPNTPIQYRRDVNSRRISWLGPRDFTLERYAPYYDYILVQGKDSDPFVLRPTAPGYQVRLVKEAGMWRLYAVDRT
jgi:hypothetical protein